MNLLTHVISFWDFLRRQPKKSDRKSDRKSEKPVVLEIKAEPIKWSDFFDDPVVYELLMSLLILERKFSSAHVWNIDNGNKAQIIGLIKYGHWLGYYKNNVMPTPQQIREIGLHTFGIDTCIGYIKHIKFEEVDLPVLPNIRDIIKMKRDLPS